MLELKNTITAQNTNLQELQKVLETELHLISSRDAEALISLLKVKEALLNTIQEQDLVISKVYTQASQELKDHPEITSLFSEAKELVNQCKFRTQINETAVEQGQLRLEHLRSLLLESRAKESMTYDKSGKTRGGSASGGISA
ncbi:flagella synthesis protein FlgN [Paraglaciecola sp. 2405UD69-4]|uniref:flagella synthesis protein FlgN n=1 Tax=Paraglaciecola sp. 2405UD69-4 TaxID=3391836 RepID=UPI0039C96F34